jgi:hypothetical protein
MDQAQVQHMFRDGRASTLSQCSYSRESCGGLTAEEEEDEITSPESRFIFEAFDSQPELQCIVFSPSPLSVER